MTKQFTSTFLFAAPTLPTMNQPYWQTWVIHHCRAWLIMAAGLGQAWQQSLLESRNIQEVGQTGPVDDQFLHQKENIQGQT